MLPGRGQGAQCRGVGSISSSFGIELLPQPANIFRLVIDHREHAAQKEQIARLQCLKVAAERRGRNRELDAKVAEPALRTAGPRAFTGYYRPACAPSSTCGTSTVTVAVFELAMPNS